MNAGNLVIVGLMLLGLCMPFATAEHIEILGLAANGTHAMVSYRTEDGFHTVLYDGSSFYELPIPKSEEELNGTVIDYEPKDWVYYDELNPAVVGYFRGMWVFNALERVALFDGKTFRVESRPDCTTCMIREFKSGKYNALFVSEKTTMLSYETLTEFDGENFKPIKIIGDSIHAIPSRDSWLIYVENKGDNHENAIYLYNGSMKKILNFSKSFHIYSMDSNDSAVLMATNYGIYSYNRNINKISPMNAHFLKWGGYWMIATGRGLFKYDGKNLTKIADSSMSIVYMVQANNFWLIAGKQGGQWRLLKYNGTFNDLTDELLNPEPWPIELPNTTGHQKKKGICGVGTLMLVSLVPLLRRKA